MEIRQTCSNRDEQRVVKRETGRKYDDAWSNFESMKMRSRQTGRFQNIQITDEQIYRNAQAETTRGKEKKYVWMTTG